MPERMPLKPITDRGERLEAQMNRFWQRSRDAEAMHAKFLEPIRDHTLFMAGHGISHRKKEPLQVGASIVALVAHPNHNLGRPLHRTAIKLFEGYNNSPYTGANKDCAEQRGFWMGDIIVHEMLKKNQLWYFEQPLLAWKALSLAVAASAGPHTNYGVNRLDWLTLDPCATPCRPALMNHPATRNDMPVDTYSFDTSWHVTAEHHETMGELMERYHGIDHPPTSAQLLAQPKAQL